MSNKTNAHDPDATLRAFVGDRLAEFLRNWGCHSEQVAAAEEAVSWWFRRSPGDPPFIETLSDRRAPSVDVEKIADEINNAIFGMLGCGVKQLAGIDVLGILRKHLATPPPSDERREAHRVLDEAIDQVKAGHHHVIGTSNVRNAILAAAKEGE